jgi:hypothetical protein
VNGVAQDHGAWQWSEHGTPTNRYEGDVRDGRHNGRGALTLASDDRFEGEFRDGSLNGPGTYRSPTGEHYEGGFLDGRFSPTYSALAGERGRLSGGRASPLRLFIAISERHV